MVRAEAAIAVASGVSAGFSVINGPRHWWSVRHLHNKLTRIYAGEGFDGNLDWEDIVRYFLLDCRSLGEWIALDPDVPAGARAEAESFEAGSCRDIALDFANSDKHRDRRYPDKDELIYIHATSGSPKGHRVELVAYLGEQELWHRDALEVADGCMAEWRAFFSEHHLAEPR